MIVLVIRGLLSVFLSRAMETLGANIKANAPHEDVRVTDHGWAFAWFSNVPRMTQWCLEAHARREKIVLVGHSFGGTSVISLLRNLRTHGITVDFAGPIDPAGQYDTSVPSNVRRGVSFYQRTPGQLGQGIVHPDHTWLRGEWDKVWEVHKRNETHLQIAADAVVQATMLSEVIKCLRKS